MVTHYAGQCYAWDVVNEALNEDGTFRTSVFFTTLNTGYLPLSFTFAAAADPAAKLYYNDFNLETSTAKADGAVKIVNLIKAAGARIDGVGFQAHLNVGQTPSRVALAATLSRFTALGVEVAYTELDIAHTKLPASDADNVKQAADYVSVVGSCLDVKGCVGITVWQFTDRYSWVPGTFPGKGEACLWDQNYKKKPAYDAVVKLLKGGASGTAATGTGTETGTGSKTNSTTGAVTSVPVRFSGGFTAGLGESGIGRRLVGVLGPLVVAVLVL